MVTPSVAFADTIQSSAYLALGLYLYSFTHTSWFNSLTIIHSLIHSPLGRSGSFALPYDPRRYRQLHVMLCCRLPLALLLFKNVSDVPPIRITSLPLFHSPTLLVSLIVQYYVIHHPVVGTLIYRVPMPGQKPIVKSKKRR